ncbi:c-type cytochrome [Undibacterium griseum]|uniref:Cytochrome c5 family protein n=1 Tax=Undibacterium griseum TaxID=2762295 RepID=A0ABR6YJ30_9BURK|nr:c-type cytochrome [Undibacterium griseum]MBC3883911.1 cytochrome c5 family protein [Undibacterium griseum]
MFRTFIQTVSAAWLLCACQPQHVTPGPQQISAAEAARPADMALSQIYQRSCISCHVSPASTAPLVGFEADWAPRLAQGQEVLLQHARDGYKAMPPKGFCSGCSDQDLRRLIEFMSTPIHTAHPAKEAA